MPAPRTSALPELASEPVERPVSPLVTPRTAQGLDDLTKWLDRRRKKGRWLIFTHDNPDPDSLAAATGLAKLLRHRFRQQTTVAYGGIIGRAENRETVRSLKLKISRVRHLNLKQYRYHALVDCQPMTGNNQLPANVTPDLVIDHHPVRKKTQESPLYDIRTEYGATASIVAEYLLAAEVPITRREATGIVYAIRSETLDFSREFPSPDRAVYDHFLDLADKRLLGRIQNPRLPVGYFHNLQSALESLETVDSLVISHLAEVEQPDIVPEIADLLLRMETKTWSFCTGQHEDRIYCSIRTTNPRADAARLMRRLLGRRGKGGGHGMLAGGWFPRPEDPEKAARVQTDLGRRLAKMLRKNPDRIATMDLGGRPKDAEEDEAKEARPPATS